MNNQPDDPGAPSQPTDKPWWLSKTIIGALVTLIGTSIGMDADGMQQLTGELVTLAGAALAVYGRVKAVTPIRGGRREGP